MLVIAGGIVLGFLALGFLSQPGVLEGIWELGKVLLLLLAVVAMIGAAFLLRHS